MTLPIPDIIPSSKSPLKNAPTSADIKIFSSIFANGNKRIVAPMLNKL